MAVSSRDGRAEEGREGQKERDAVPGVNYIHTDVERGVGLEQSGILQEETALYLKDPHPF